MSIKDRTVALAEGRQLDDLVAMLEKEGARPLRCPLLSILDAPDDGPTLDWLDMLAAGRFDWVVFLTGEGVRRVLSCADRHGRRQQAIDALARTRVVTRGPKPGIALKEIGIAPSKVAKVPTTDGVISALSDEALAGRTIGVQLYSPEPSALVEFLQSSGVVVHAMLPYVYAPKSDAASVVDVIRKLDAGHIDAIVFTSSPQIDRFFDVAAEAGVADALARGLQNTVVAAVGPIVQENLVRRGFPAKVCPEQGFQMKNLVVHLTREFARHG